MPTIHYEGPRMTKEQKQELAKEITRISCEILNKPAHTVTILFKENDPEDIAVGGTLVSELDE